LVGLSVIEKAVARFVGRGANNENLDIAFGVVTNSGANGDGVAFRDGDSFAIKVEETLAP
jgi:hypothetical protein